MRTAPSYLEELCHPTEFLDYTSPVVRDFVRMALPDPWATTAVERARALYYAVRDRIQYEVYGIDLSREGLRASSVIARGSGFCVHKTIVYAAVARSVGVPCRLMYGDVRNHLTSQRLTRLVGGNVFRFHALNSQFLEGRWVKVTPVFPALLCRLYGVAPLEFDGVAGSQYHPYDENSRRHMEFLRWHGEFDDFPYELVVAGIRVAHPRLFDSGYRTGYRTGNRTRDSSDAAGGRKTRA
jgi:transglutaminase-like putative cysteine protease